MSVPATLNFFDFFISNHLLKLIFCIIKVGIWWSAFLNVVKFLGYWTIFFLKVIYWCSIDQGANCRVASGLLVPRGFLNPNLGSLWAVAFITHSLVVIAVNCTSGV